MSIPKHNLLYKKTYRKLFNNSGFLFFVQRNIYKVVSEILLRYIIDESLM